MSPPASPSRASPVRSPVAAAVEAAASTRSLEDAIPEDDDASASASASAPSRALVDDLRARLRVAHEDLAAAHERERAHGAGLEHFRDRQAAITAELGRVSELDADLRAARAELADARDAERDARDAEARAVAAEKRAAASETAALARVRELEYAGGDRVVFSDSPGAQIVAKIRADAAERAVDDLVAARGLAPAAMGTPGNGDGSSPESNPASLVRAAVAEAEARTRDRFAARVETLENQLKDARDQRDREALLRSNSSRADQSSLAGAVPGVEDAPESSSPESLIALRRRAEDAESALASSAFELALATTARDALEGELESTREDLAAAREEVAALRRRLATRPSAEAATAAQQQRTPGGGDDGGALGAQTATPAPRSLSRLAPEWNTASPSPDAFAGLAPADGPSPRPIAVDAADAASAGPSPPSVLIPRRQREEQQQHSARRSVAALVTRAAEEAAERRGLLTPGGGMEWERRLAEAAEAAARDARDQWAEERAALERNVRDAHEDLAAARALEAEAESREAALGRELAALEAEAAALRESTRAAKEEAEKARSVVVAKEKGDDEALAALESAAAKLREKNAALREMLAETEADAASFREDAERTRARCAELEKELVEERNAETSSKPAGAARVRVEASSHAEANTVVSAAKKDSSSLDGEVDSLRRELEATRRVCSIQEEEVCRATAAAAARAAESADWTNAEAAASIPRALLERWRGEVFKLLLERRADGSGSGSSPRGGREAGGGGREGVELRSGSSKADSDEKTSALEAEKASLAAKLDALEARLERAAESESRAKAEAAEARETAAATAAVAAADRSRVRALAESAFALRATFEAKARELRDADERLASMRRRVAFAERRVRSHRAFVDASGGVGTAAGNERAEAGTSNPPFATLRSDATSDVVADALASSDARTLAAELRRVESERVSLLRTLGATSRELRASKSALAEARAEASEALRRAAKSDATLEALKSALDAQKAETRDARIKAVDIATRADEKMAEQRRRLERDAEEAAEHAKRSAERSAEAERRSADAERRLAEAEADAAQTRLGLGRDLEAARREATRHAVAARQAERLMAKMRDARAEEDAAKFEALEARCANREEAAEALRRERNALLAEVRATEKQQGKSGGGVKSGGGSNKKAGGAMTREASSEASGEEASGFLFPAKSRLGFSPKSPPRRGARRGLRLADGDHRNHAEARRDRGVVATEGIETGAIDRSGGSISPERGGGGAAEGGAAAVTLADLEASPSWQLQRRLQSLERRAAALLEDEEEEAAAEAAMLAEAEAVEGAR
jgi:hypothetical protein